MSDLKYFPIVWDFCCKTNNDKLKKIKKELWEYRTKAITLTMTILLKCMAGTNKLITQRLRFMASNSV